MADLALNQTTQPEPDRSLLSQYGLGVLENYKPGSIAPDLFKVDILGRELLRFGIQEKHLYSLEVSKPSPILSDSNFANEEVLVGYSASCDKQGYYFMRDDYRTLPFLLIAGRTVKDGEIRIKYGDEAGEHVLSDQRIAFKVYKTLSDLHKDGIKTFQGRAGFRPFS